MNIIYQQELGKNKEENSFKMGASCQLDSVNENLIRRYLYDNTISGLSFKWLEVVPGIYGEFNHNSEKFGVISGLRLDYTSYYSCLLYTSPSPRD